MRIIVILLIAASINIGLKAQADTLLSDPDQLVLPVPDNDKRTEIKADEKKLDIDLTVGTSFLYSPGNFYGPSFYAAPSLSYQINPRFRLSAGVALERGGFYPLHTSSGEDDSMLPMTRAFMFARGSYQVSPRLTIGGSAYKSINDVPRLEEYGVPLDYNYEGVSFDINYRLSNSISVGFQMRMQNGGGYYYYNPNSLIPPAGYVPVPGF